VTTLRKSIRAQVTALLKAASTAAGDRVYPSRFYPFWKQPFPLITVFTPSEDSTVSGQYPTHEDRRVRVNVQAIARTVEADCEDSLDDLCDEIEDVLDVDDNWQLTGISRTEYTGTEIEIIADEQAEAKYVAAIMSFDVYYQYVVEPVAPDDVDSVEVNGNTIST
jgi:hypothetical protein